MSSPSMDHKGRVVQEFTRQAQAYAASPLIANPDRLVALVQAVQAEAGMHVLDVATGPGFVAAAFAEVDCEVVGLDLTNAPLKLAEQMRDSRGLTNLRFQQGDAEKLPFEQQSFDIVVSRYAMHHFEDPRRVLREMARVCRPQGKVVIQDLITSEFAERAAYQNHVEQLRDPSHARALALSEFLAFFTVCGLEIEQVVTDRLTQNLESWLANAHTPLEKAAQVRELLARDEQDDLSGTRPFHMEEMVYFYQRIVTLIARKIVV